MKYNELATRLLIAVLAIPIIFAAIYFGKIYFIVLVDLIIVMALWELYKLVELKGFSPSKILGILSVLVISWELYLNNGNGLRLVLLIILLVTLVFELFKGRENPLVNSAVTLFGIFYISLFSCFILIREFPVHNNLKYQTGGFIVIMILPVVITS